MPATVGKCFLSFLSRGRVLFCGFGALLANRGSVLHLRQLCWRRKNTARALVRIGYDGRVHKYFRGPQARERYENSAGE